MKNSWYSITAKAGSTPEILLYDEIGAWGITAADFHRDLTALGDMTGKALDLRISSPGGDVFAGNAIANMLRGSGADITVYVDGVAASMASLVAMVGEPVIMAANAVMMIHNPASFVGGTSREMKRIASLLDSLKSGMVAGYVEKTGLAAEVVSQMMEDETWMTAEEAVAHGFADSIGKESKLAASFDLSKFKHPPKAHASTAAAPVAIAQPKETSMEKTEVEQMISAANKPILDAIAALAKPAETATETAAQIEARVNADRDAYEAEVAELCALAGQPDKAQGFVKAKTALDEVRASLVAGRTKPAPVRHAPNAALRNHVGTGTESAEHDHSDLIVTAINSSDVWKRRNAVGGNIARMRIASDA